MYLPGHAIPFSISVDTSDLVDGTIMVHGLISYTDRVLIFEIQKTDQSMAKSETTRHELSLAQIQVVEFKRRVVGSKIFIETTTIDSLNGLPGTSQNRIGLFIKRKHRDRVASFVTHVQIELTELRLDQM